MALTRPIVLIYQTTKSISVTPGTPKLNCCYVGPCFSIQDYPDDKLAISTDDFIASGKTKDSACSDTDGSSTGRPADNADFLVLTDPPGHSGIQGNLDAASVDAVFDETLIELDQGIDVTGVGPAALAENDYEVYSATSDFVTNMVMPGDRLILTKNAPDADDDHTVLKVVKSVTDLHTLVLTTVFSAAEIVLLGTADINWRVEHKLDDQRIDASKYVVVLGNQITIKTGATGLLLPYTNDTAVAAVDYPVNYAEMYIGSRELRTDLQAVSTVNSPAEILSQLGRTDERNPLAVACSVGLANTTTPVQYFGISTDNLAGHQAAMVNTSARSDMYAITPITDSISGGDWVSVISSWKSQAAQLDDAEKAKYRVILGSYDTLPTDKSSAPASLLGTTQLDPVNTTLNDVFVDPHAAADFHSAAIAATHLLDITHADGAPPILTAPNDETIFNDAYPGAYGISGVIGSKRLRTSVAMHATADYAPAVEQADYFVREKIRFSEGGTSKASVVSCTWADNGAGIVRIAKAASGAFASVVAGDVVHVSGAATALHNEGFVIDAVDGVASDYIDIYLDHAVDVNSGSIDVEVYTPVASTKAAEWIDDHTIDAGTNGDFAGMAVGDVIAVFANKDRTFVNRGMWIVTSVDTGAIPDRITVAYDGTYKFVDPVTDTMTLAAWHTKASRGCNNVVARRRLTRLMDATASFITDVKPGEDIEIPYPASAGVGLGWDTTTTKWLIKTVVNDNILDADLEALEELAPKDYIVGFAGDCPYRVSIELNKSSQVTELNTITTGLKHFRVVMVWPNECTVTDLKNALTDIQGKHHGQYLAAAVGGMITGLPPHQGFTFITVGGISQIYNSNFYFGDDQITSLCEGGWYVFLQDSEASPPYCALECTTDTAAYETGELMYVKDFDYLALGFKNIMQGFLGRYNLLPETLGILNDAFYVQADSFKGDRHERIGAPLISAEIIILEKHGTEKGRAELYAEIEIPEVLNKIGMHLIA